MLYNLFYPLHETLAFFNLFRYITFRASMAAVSAFLASLIFGPLVINLLRRMQIGEKVVKQDSQFLDDLHKSKQGTPTMGGIFIVLAIVVSTLLWADATNRYIHLVLFGTVWLAITGFFDDYLKQKKSVAKGLTVRSKIISQVALGVIIGYILFKIPGGSRLDFPFLKELYLELGVWFILVAILVITGTSNAVNLTDGLDGLAIGCVSSAALAFSVLSYVSGNIKLSQYLLIPYIRDSGELTVFCASIFGAGLGFLWFNCYPASIFMGDVGSLALGGALGIVSLIIKKELLLVIVGGVFVLEALSVILQVACFRLFRKRILRCAPIHHHFQFLGWKENKIIVRFWILAILFAVLTLVTLKVR